MGKSNLHKMWDEKEKEELKPLVDCTGGGDYGCGHLCIEDYSETIYHFGKYTIGLTGEEIDEFIKKITGKKRVKGLVKKFDKAFGRGHTCAIMQCDECNYQEPVFYHCDVLKALREIGVL